MGLARTPYSNLFQPKHFGTVINKLGYDSFLMDSIDLPTQSETRREMQELAILFHSCQGWASFLKSIESHPSQLNSSLKSPQEIRINHSLLDFWATWELGRYAVLSRLKTPLGDPIQV